MLRLKVEEWRSCRHRHVQLRATAPEVWTCFCFRLSENVNWENGHDGRKCRLSVNVTKCSFQTKVPRGNFWDFAWNKQTKGSFSSRSFPLTRSEGNLNLIKPNRKTNVHIFPAAPFENWTDWKIKSEFYFCDGIKSTQRFDFNRLSRWVFVKTNKTKQHKTSVRWVRSQMGEMCVWGDTHLHAADCLHRSLLSLSASRSLQSTSLDQHATPAGDPLKHTQYRKHIYKTNKQKSTSHTAEELYWFLDISEEIFVSPHLTTLCLHSRVRSNLITCPECSWAQLPPPYLGSGWISTAILWDLHVTTMYRWWESKHSKQQTDKHHLITSSNQVMSPQSQCSNVLCSNTVLCPCPHSFYIILCKLQWH